MGTAKDIDRSGLVIGDDGIARCYWREADPLYRDYHDLEWGTPIGGDDALFERICLEGFQSGLSWLTVLRKRDAFRAAFAGFEIRRVAGFADTDVERLMGDPAIIRNRAKIKATVNNARRALDLIREEGSLGAWIWRFEPARNARTRSFDLARWREITRSAASTKMSNELKRRGWAFVGPATCYAAMQAVGMVNDHMDGCACRKDVELRRERFLAPRTTR